MPDTTVITGENEENLMSGSLSEPPRRCTVTSGTIERPVLEAAPAWSCAAGMAP